MGKKKETKESMGADASGSVEPALNNVILKKDIHKLHNFDPKEEELDEITGAGVSAGAMYDAPIGHRSKDPLQIDNPDTSFKNTPTFRNKSLRFGGKGGKIVQPKKKCRRFPYCNQGDIGALELYETKEVQDAIVQTSKKYKIPLDEVKKLVKSRLMEGIEDLFRDNDENEKALLSMVKANRISKGIYNDDDDVFIVTMDENAVIETRDEVNIYKLMRLLDKFGVNYELKRKSPKK